MTKTSHVQLQEEIHREGALFAVEIMSKMLGRYAGTPASQKPAPKLLCLFVMTMIDFAAKQHDMHHTLC